MSIKLMNAAWELPIEPTQKLVLLALADWADETTGICWPSIRKLAVKTHVSESTVKRMLRGLEAADHITKQFRSNETTRYLVHPREGGQFDPPGHVRPQGGVTADPLYTNDTSVGSGAKAPSPPRESFELPPDIPADAWTDFEEMRRSIKAPLTDVARKLAVKKLRALAAAGSPMRDVLEQSTMNSWKGLFAVKAGFGDRPGIDRPKTAMEIMQEPLRG